MRYLYIYALQLQIQYGFVLAAFYRNQLLCYEVWVQRGKKRTKTSPKKVFKQTDAPLVTHDQKRDLEIVELCNIIEQARLITNGHVFIILNYTHYIDSGSFQVLYLFRPSKMVLQRSYLPVLQN